jgi:two-component system nitrate/nitrite response regulator NarL
VVLGDDHAVFVDTLGPLLERRGIRVVGTGRTLPEVVEAVRQHAPDVCLLDRHFGATVGKDGVTEVVAANKHTKVIVLTADTTSSSVLDALRSGAVGYVHKTRGLDQVTRAVERAMAGEVLIDVPWQWRERQPSDEAAEMRRLAGHLTGRERQCLSMLAEGLSTAEMTERLGVSTTTVRTHVHALLTKLGVHSRLEAASCAVRYGLVDTPPAGAH